MTVTTQSEITLSIATIMQILGPLLAAGAGLIGWTLKRIVGKMENNIEELHKGVTDMNDKCIKAEAVLRKEDALRESAFRVTIDALRAAANECKSARAKEHQELLVALGYVRERISSLEAKIK